LNKNLLSIEGVGKTRASKLCVYIGVLGTRLLKDIPSVKIDKLEKVLNYYKKGQNSSEVVGSSVKIQKKKNISRLVRINCHKGRRHRLGLPVRGQRTRTNGITTKRVGNK